MDKLWKQITPSDYAWEREALGFLKERLPDHEPYRVWANFEFIALDGSVNEVDALVCSPKGLFLVEIKSHPSEIGGDAGTWVWTHEGRRRAFDNPRLLAERKAKKLRSLLEAQRSAVKGGSTIAFIETLVFLSAEGVVNHLEGHARLNVYTRDGVLAALTRLEARDSRRRIDRPASKAISRAMEEAGVKECLRVRRVGLYELTELLDESDQFQDWRATHGETGVHRRISGSHAPAWEPVPRRSSGASAVHWALERPGMRSHAGAWERSKKNSTRGASPPGPPGSPPRPLVNPKTSDAVARLRG